MPDISHINGVAIANISKLLGRTLATNDNVSGVTKPSAAGTATTFLTKQSSWANSGGKTGLAKFVNTLPICPKP